MADEFMGKGKVWLRSRTVAGAVRYQIGNCSELSFSFEQEKKTVPDFTTSGGGNAKEKSRIKSCSLKAKLYSLKAENIALAMRGTKATASLTPVVDEVAAAAPGALVLLANLPDPAVALVVESQDGKSAATWAATTARAAGVYIVPGTPNGYYYKVTAAGTSGSSAPTFPTTPGATVTDGTITLTNMGNITKTLDVDFTRTGVGFVMSSTAGSCESGRNLLVDYTPRAANVIEAMTSAGDEYELVFDGLNEAQSDLPVSLIAYSVVFDPTSGFGWISDDFASLELTGAVQSAPEITAAGKSKFYRVLQATA